MPPSTLWKHYLSMKLQVNWEDCGVVITSPKVVTPPGHGGRAALTIPSRMTSPCWRTFCLIITILILYQCKGQLWFSLIITSLLNTTESVQQRPFYMQDQSLKNFTFLHGQSLHFCTQFLHLHTIFAFCILNGNNFMSSLNHKGSKPSEHLISYLFLSPALTPETKN